MSSQARKTVFMSPAARIAVAAALVALVLSLVDARSVWSHLERFDVAVGLAMLAVNAVLFALFAARWRAVAGALGIEARYARFFCATWLGAFFSQLGPALILNEITRFRVLQPYADTWPLAASQLLDRVSGQIVLAGVILLLTPYYLGLFAADVGGRIVLTAGLVIVLGGSLLVLAYRFRRVIRIRPGAMRAILNPLASPTHYACSLAIQLLLMANLWLAARGLGLGGHGIALYLVAPLILGSLTLLPISVADWGSREAVALLFFYPTGLSAEQIVAISVIYGAINLVSALPAALLLVARAGGARAGRLPASSPEPLQDRAASASAPDRCAVRNAR